MGRVSPPHVVLLLVRFIDGLSIDVGHKEQSRAGEGRILQFKTDSGDVVDVHSVAHAPGTGPEYAWAKAPLHSARPEGRCVGRTGPDPGCAKRDGMRTSEVLSVVSVVESAIAVSPAGRLVIVAALVVAGVTNLVLVPVGIAAGFRRTLVRVALVTVGIALIPLSVALIMLGVAIVVLGVAIVMLGVAVVVLGVAIVVLRVLSRSRRARCRRARCRT